MSLIQSWLFCHSSPSPFLFPFAPSPPLPYLVPPHPFHTHRGTQAYTLKHTNKMAAYLSIEHEIYNQTDNLWLSSTCWRSECVSHTVCTICSNFVYKLGSTRNGVDEQKEHFVETGVLCQASLSCLDFVMRPLLWGLYCLLKAWPVKHLFTNCRRDSEKKRFHFFNVQDMLVWDHLDGILNFTTKSCL